MISFYEKTKIAIQIQKYIYIRGNLILKTHK